jgi:hypothetical protein
MFRIQNVRAPLAALTLAFAVAGVANSQAIPDLYGRYRGTGHLEFRATNEKRQLSEATIDLLPSGALAIAIRGRDVDIAMVGRVTGWTRKHQVHVELDRFDGQPTDIQGWIRFDDRGGFEHLALNGKEPKRFDVSFTPEGRSLESVRPRPSVERLEITEEPGTIRRGLELRSFRTGFLRDCLASCRTEERCVGYTYLERESQCFLLGTVSSGEPHRDAVSGVKRSVVRTD